MFQPQFEFNQICIDKNKIKELQAMKREALNNDKIYQNAITELETIRNERKMAICRVEEDLKEEMEKLSQLKEKVKEDDRRLKDGLLDKLVKGESIELGEGRNKVRAVLEVKFIKE